MNNLTQRIRDWYTTGIGRKMRLLGLKGLVPDCLIKHKGYYSGRLDPCDISDEELRAMRRRFDGCAEKIGALDY